MKIFLESGNQGTTVELNKVKPEYAYRDQRLSRYISIKDKKEWRGRLKNKVLKIGGQLRCHLGDPIGDAEAKNTIVKKPIGI